MLGNLSLALPWWLCAGPAGNGEQLQHVQSMRDYVMALKRAHVELALTQHLYCAGLQCPGLVEQWSKAEDPHWGWEEGEKSPSGT